MQIVHQYIYFDQLYIEIIKFDGSMEYRQGLNI